MHRLRMVENPGERPQLARRQIYKCDKWIKIGTCFESGKFTIYSSLEYGDSTLMDLWKAIAKLRIDQVGAELLYGMVLL